MNKVSLLMHWMGDNKCKSFAFWYMIGYLLMVCNELYKWGDYSWHTFFPLKLFPMYISVFFAPIHYKAIHGEGDVKWVIDRGVKLGVVFIGTVLITAILEKKYHIGVFWLLM